MVGAGGQVPACHALCLSFPACSWGGGRLRGDPAFLVLGWGGGVPILIRHPCKRLKAGWRASARVRIPTRRQSRQWGASPRAPIPTRRPCKRLGAKRARS